MDHQEKIIDESRQGEILKTADKIGTSKKNVYRKLWVSNEFC